MRGLKAGWNRVAAFWAKVQKGDGCWLWQGKLDKDGYGLCWWNHRWVVAHRVSFELREGHPSRLDVLHACDTPGCVRPDHLFEGTKQDNRADCVAKGRQACGLRSGRVTRPESTARGERHGRAKLTWAQVRSIRQSDDSKSHLAKKFGVHPKTIAQVQRMEIWKETAHEP
jgi:hypothetical protein